MPCHLFSRSLLHRSFVPLGVSMTLILAQVPDQGLVHELLRIFSTSSLLSLLFAGLSFLPSSSERVSSCLKPRRLVCLHPPLFKFRVNEWGTTEKSEACPPASSLGIVSLIGDSSSILLGVHLSCSKNSSN